MRKVIVIAKPNSAYKTTEGFYEQLRKTVNRVGFVFDIKLERLHDVRFEIEYMSNNELYNNDQYTKLTLLEEKFFKDVIDPRNTDMPPSPEEVKVIDLRRRLHRYFNLDTSNGVCSIGLFIILKICQFLGILVEKVWLDRRIRPSACTGRANLTTMNIQQAIQTYQRSLAPGAPPPPPMGDGIVVGVLDGGMNIANGNIANQLWQDPNHSNQMGIDCLTPITATGSTGAQYLGTNIGITGTFYHGTEVGGIITSGASVLCCIAPQAKVVNIKVADSASGNVSYFMRGLNVCAQAVGYPILAKVINISWTFDDSFFDPLLFSGEDQIEYAYSRGCMIVFSAGNDKTDAASKLPPNHNRCIVVAGADNNKKWWWNLASYKKRKGTNYGAAVTIAAPADGLCTTASDSNDLTPFNGTSAAAPHIAGLIAVMLSRNPNLVLDGAGGIKDLLQRGATVLEFPTNFLSPPRPHGELKLVNAETVLAAI